MAKKKEETEQRTEQSDTSITEKIGNVVSAVGDRIGEVASPVGEKLGQVASGVGDAVGGVVSAVTGGNSEEAHEAKDNSEESHVAARGNGEAADNAVASVTENEEALPTAITKGARANQAKELPEYMSSRRTEVGRVVSDKMQKTVVVSVERSKQHPLYKKIMRRTVKFMAHDEMNSGMGDTVRIIESRPMSRRKRWRVVEIIQKAQQI